MKYFALIAISLFLASCASQIETNYEVEFGIIENREVYPLKISKFTTTIPWRAGDYEPFFVAHAFSDTKSQFNVHQKIYRVASDRSIELLHQSEYWRVKGGANEGGFLSVDLNDREIFGENVYGDYLFAVYIESWDEPFKVIPFKIVESD